MDKLMLYHVAKMYYIDQMGQQQISQRLGISRPQISRMLKEARSSGIVRITLNSPFQTSKQGLGERLCDALGIRRAHVVDTDGVPADGAGRRQELVTSYAAEYIAEAFRESRWVGVGWGAGVYHTVLRMQYSQEKSNLCFAPLVGSAGLDAPHFQTNSIVDRIAEKYRADKVFLNAPAFIEGEEVYHYLKENNRLDQEGGIWGHLDLAFFSLGLPLRMNQPILSYLGGTEYREQLLEKDCIGDLLGRFVGADGEFCLPEGSGCISISQEKLRKAKRKICLAYGVSKSRIIIAAAKKFRVIDELITDDVTAMALLDEKKELSVNTVF